MIKSVRVLPDSCQPGRAWDDRITFMRSVELMRSVLASPDLAGTPRLRLSFISA